MEYQKVVISIIVILAIIAVYLALVTIKPVQPEVNTTAAEELLLKGVRFGMYESTYQLSYNELADGYRTYYSMEEDGENQSIYVQNPLSTKKAYYFSNETILCIKYPLTANESCASVYGNAELKNYMASLSSKFLNDALIERYKNDMSYLISKNYVKLSPDITTKTINGKQCQEISYQIDYSNISLDDAARFGIGSDAPKKFNWKMCIDNQTGWIYSKYFDYKENGTTHTYEYQLVSFKKGEAAIVAPAELVDSVISILYQEREQYSKLAKCYTDKQGDDRERCITTMAITLKRKDLCDLTGQRRDTCLIALVPITKDEDICKLIVSQSVKDDCYIELAGAYKNSSYCSQMQNSSKLDQCYAAAKVAQQTPFLPPSDLCDAITNESSKDQCNMMQAMAHKDNSYCDKITNDSLVPICLNYTSGNYSGNMTTIDPEFAMGLVNSSVDFIKYLIALKNGSANGTIPLPPLPPLPN
ncbi:Uncharacterised protein [Candidatus Bilamarchaeum dharawalense]|uniref:Uncharacterized protein n=1 Tax=Candidatus Bilamarchaeum dharawalense TaxID=2885759 RepID=A0A5E4LL48_9ARCH|nr:Uncharacterised protein [Candidatus Bilamarchaeum dharawalense]